MFVLDVIYTDLTNREGASPTRTGGFRISERQFIAVENQDAHIEEKEKNDRKEQTKLLELFDNPAPQRDFRIVHVCHEFTSVCPKTGQPDFATITVEYIPDMACLELKALKFYFQAFRNQGIFYEAVVNQILDDLVAACAPRSMTIIGNFNVRGGFSSVVTAEYRKS